MRSPRFFEPLPQDVIDIEAPPQKQNRKKQPMLFVLGPALTMPLPMLATMVLRMGVGNGMGSYWIMGVSVVMSALIGLGWSLARRKYDAKEETAEESERQSAYRSYLQKNEALLQQRQAICRERLLRQYPSTPELFPKADWRTGRRGALEPQRAGRGFHDRAPRPRPDGHFLHDPHARRPVQHPERRAGGAAGKAEGGLSDDPADPVPIVHRAAEADRHHR